MRAPDRVGRRVRAGFLVTVALGSALGGGCATNPVPPHQRISAEKALMSGRGAYAVVQRTTGDAFAGELIAAGNEGIQLLTGGAKLMFIPYPTVVSVKVGVHSNNADVLGIWTTLGTLSSISHGFFAVFTIPIWLGFGVTTTVGESNRGLFECPPQPLAALKVYSRFPQGVPPGVDEDQLLGKPPRAQPVAAPAAQSVVPPTPPDPAVDKPKP